MKLRYSGVCGTCGAALAAKAEAVYDQSTKTAHCLGDSDDQTRVVSALSRQRYRSPSSCLRRGAARRLPTGMSAGGRRRLGPGRARPPTSQA